MIVVDTEFTSLDFNKGGLWQIGAIDLENPENTFLEEARLEDDDEVQQATLDVVGKTEEELRDKSKQSQKEMLINFFEWVKKIRIKHIFSQGPWDFSYLFTKSKKFGLEYPFHHRTFDLHSIAQMKYAMLYGKLFIEKDYSAMGLRNVLEFCGMEDKRRNIGRNGETSREGSPHNALEDARLEAECFSRILFGKNLLPEFNKFPIPEYLRVEK